MDIAAGISRTKPMSRYKIARFGVSGFTLLEMMLTVGLIALTATFVGISISGSDSRLARLEAERFVTLLNLAQDESILTGRPIVLSIDTGSQQYSFAVLDFDAVSFTDDVVDDEAITEQDTDKLSDAFLKTRKLPQSVSLLFELEEDLDHQAEDGGLRIESVHELLNRSLFDNDEDKLFEPDTSQDVVLVEPNGVISPFNLTFSNENQNYIVELNRFGRAAISEP